eukprot:m.363674 g.363674  ORF g.363674 m.363674 type:complete len:246 (-) comp23478_c0_seq1:2188-2925(-)
MEFASVNVHCAYPENDEYPMLVPLLTPFDVVLMQECPAETAMQLKKDTKRHLAHYRDCSILSKEPIVSKDTIALGPVDKCAVKAKLDSGLCVACVHLDHQSEDTRAKQVQKLEPWLKDVDILGGDFNALHKGDYSEGRWMQIDWVRRERSWLEPARSEVMEMVKGLGYTLSKYVGPTTPYHTRVDYFALRPNLTIDKTWLVPTIEQEVTDHNMVCASIRVTPAPSAQPCQSAQPHAVHTEPSSRS